MPCLLSQKEMLESIVAGLSMRGFETCEFDRACFDVLAKNERYMIAMKLLHNIDSFSAEQAYDLKKITAKINASPLIVGCIGRNFTLKDDYVYERFNIPVVNPETLENTLENIAPVFYSRKGKTISYIFSGKIREMRARQKISLKELSEKTGVSKKTLFMGEKYSKMSADAVQRIEEYFSASFTAPIDVLSWAYENDEKRNEMTGDAEKRAISYFSRSGFECMYFRTAPVKFINTYENRSILSTIVGSVRSERVIKDLKNMSEMSLNDKMIISLSGREKNIDGVASVSIDELKRISTCSKLFEIIYDRE